MDSRNDRNRAVEHHVLDAIRNKELREARRMAVAHQVLDAIRSKELRRATEANRSGEHVIVPALLDDTMADLFEQLESADGPLHVAVRHGDELVLFAMAPHTPRHAGANADTEDPCPIHPDTPVSMVLDYLRLAGAPILCREASPEVSLELVDRTVEATPLLASHNWWRPPCDL